MDLKKIISIGAVLFLTGTIFAEDVAVFPAQSVNTDKSFIDAFGMLLAKKYEKASGKRAYSPLKSERAVGTDGNLVKAAANLGVTEYLEIEAVGLYKTKTKRQENNVVSDSNGGTQVIVNINNEDDNDDVEQSDQQLLDNSKTIVTVTRRDRMGAEIYRVEMTLLTYGDIEESCDRFAQSLWNRIPVEKTRSMTNITRREGMGNNRLFTETHKGVKICGIYPSGYRGENISSVVGIGYDMRFDSEKFFMELGIGARIPTAMYDNNSYSYGGVALDMGVDYFVIPGSVAAVYAGGGIVPSLITGGYGLQFALAPYIQAGVVAPRMTRAQFYFEIRASQHVMPVKGQYDEEYQVVSEYSSYTYTSYRTVTTTFRPFEIGFNVGIQF